MCECLYIHNFVVFIIYMTLKEHACVCPWNKWKELWGSGLYTVSLCTSNSVQLTVHTGAYDTVYIHCRSVLDLTLWYVCGYLSMPRLALQPMCCWLSALGLTLQCCFPHSSAILLTCFVPHLRCGMLMRFPEEDRIGDFCKRSTLSIRRILKCIYFFEWW